MKNILLLSIILSILFLGCTSNQAAPTTPTPAPTATITPVPTPDLRIITQDSVSFMCTQQDLPKNIVYTFFPEENGPYTNETLIANLGTQVAEEMIEKTGRIEGWFRFFHRVTIDLNGCNISRFETAEGAQLYLKEYSGYLEIPDSTVADLDLDGIDYGFIVDLLYKKFASSSTDTHSRSIAFTYKNIVVLLFTEGLEDEIDLLMLDNLAKNILAKLTIAPLELP